MPEDRVDDSEEDRSVFGIACVDSKRDRVALVSTRGNHCLVWRGGRRRRLRSSGQKIYTEFVVKYPRDQYVFRDAQILANQYRLLRDALGDIVPEAIFVMSCIEGQPNMFVLARAVNVWFNIANPMNRDEAIGLLRDNEMARVQLGHFIAQARRWREGPNPRVIDLYGLDNLVMDNQWRIRYVDSFYVFFFEDMLHMLGGEPDYELQEKIEVSLRRLAYLEEILAASSAEAEQGPSPG